MDILIQSSYHFWFSGLAGLSGWLLTWTTFYALSFAASRYSLLKICTAANYGMKYYPWLVVLSFSLFAHWAQDWFTTPLGQSLDIIR